MDKFNLIPQVSSLKKGKGEFVLDPESRIVVASEGAIEPGRLLSDYLHPATGFALPVVADVVAAPGDILLSETGHNELDEAGFGDESYTLEVDPENIVLNAPGTLGLLRAIQTLRQLLPAQIYSQTVVDKVEWRVSAVDIADEPTYRWRGLHFDVSRHFFPVDDVCRFIELQAQHKFNVLHWHLTDDQGWRVEIKKYPKLTEVGAWRDETLIGHDGCFPHRFDGKRHGGFYTQAEIRRVVAFAARRGIVIVPEIDMPGHMQAAIAAYPELGNHPGEQQSVRTHWGICQSILNPSPATVKFMQNVLSEVLKLFPSKYIHVGGDEAFKYEWDNSTYANKRMIEVGAHNSHELQSWFIGEMVRFLEKKGRRTIGWDEILEGGLPVGAAVMSWRGEQGAIDAAKQKHDFVNASNEYTYFDYYQANPAKEPLAIGGYLACEKVYSYSPVPKALNAEEAVFALGGQGQLWTEYMADFSYVEYMTYPRACALVEKLWRPDSKCDFRDFLDRLGAHRARLAVQNVNAHKLP